MFAFTALFGRRNETLVRSCQPSMYSASADFTRAAEVRFNALERRAVVVAKPAARKVERPCAADLAKAAAVAICGTVAMVLDDFSSIIGNPVDDDGDSFFLYNRMDADMNNPMGDMMMN